MGLFPGPSGDASVVLGPVRDIHANVRVPFLKLMFLRLLDAQAPGFQKPDRVSIGSCCSRKSASLHTASSPPANRWADSHESKNILPFACLRFFGNSLSSGIEEIRALCCRREWAYPSDIDPR